MSLRQISKEEFQEDRFYMPRAGLEYVCDETADEWPDDPWTMDRWQILETSDGDLIASAIGGFGPREPDLVWDGPLWDDIHEASWICSEDDLSDEQRALMDRVAKHCPGGLGGWS